ncbi:MAG TPA: cytochrome c, partial [Bacteroidia bacterium]|nr:cytochrome c [Bacteroidia bacterium]
ADHTSDAVQRESDGALFYKISMGKGNMQPYRTLLTVKQRWALVNYIRTLSSGNGKAKAMQN